MNLNRWKVFRNLDPAVAAQVRLAYTWGEGTAGFIVLDNDDMYCVGYHKAGILAGKKTAKFPRKVEALCGIEITDIQCGNNFVMVLTKDGKLYDWVNTSQPKLRTGLPDDIKIIQICAGGGHSAALTSCGVLFCWGTNKFGQVGNGSFESQGEPQKVLPLSGIPNETKVIACACGPRSTFAVTEDGNAWGWGSKTEVGHGAADRQNTPLLILEGKNIAKIICSSTCTVAVGKDFNLYFWHKGVGIMQPREINGTCVNPILEVGSSFHSNFIAYSTTAAVSVVGEWCGKYCDQPMMTSYSTIDEAFASCASPTMFRPTRPFRPPIPASRSFLQALFNDASSSDVKFIVDDEVIYAHKAILKKRCPYFANMFGHEWRENTIDGAIPIVGYSCRVYRGFLNYLYTERIESLEFDVILELLKAADFYHEQELGSKCEQFLKLGVNAENICLVYEVATKHNAKNLKQFVLDFAALRFTDVVNSEGFAGLDNDLKTQLIRELAADRTLVVTSKIPDPEEEDEAIKAQTDEFHSIS